MGHTQVWGIPYPEPDMTPDGAGQMRALSEAVDALFQYGFEELQLVKATKASGDITFPTAFPSGTTPIVLLTVIESGYAGHVTINQVTNTGFHVDIEAIPGWQGTIQDFPGPRRISWLALAPRAAAGTP